MLKTLNDEAQASSSLPNPPPTIAEETEDGDGSGSAGDSSSELSVGLACTARPQIFRPREQLMLRANSLKKAIRQIIEHAEKGNPSGALLVTSYSLLRTVNFLYFGGSRLLY